MYVWKDYIAHTCLLITTNAAGPVVHTPVFSLLTELTTHPPQFTITCPSSSSPPLSTVWSRDGTEVAIGGEQFESSQVLVNASSSHYDNVLSVTGDLVGVYRCEVRNDRGSSRSSLTVRGELVKPPMRICYCTWVHTCKSLPVYVSCFAFIPGF